MKREYTLSNVTTPPDPTIARHRGYLEGFAQSPSVKQGDSVKFGVSTLAAFTAPHTVTTVSCAMKIYLAIGRTRATDSLMSSEVSFTGTFYPLHDWRDSTIFPGDTSRFSYDYRKGCNWLVAVKYAIPSNWPSGFYYAKIYLSGHEQDSVGYIPFVVRAASPGAGSKKILCVIAWNTYQAYNYWGGGSLYWWMGTYNSPDQTQYGASLIRTVSFRRPFTQFVWDGNEITNQLGQFESRERAFVFWAEHNGYSMEYCLDADLNGDARIANNYKAAIFPGHSEYWTRLQRANIENQQPGTGFKSTNGNLSFFAANNCFWKVDYFPSAFPPTSNPDSMLCDKETTATNKAGNNLWRYQSEGGEAKFIGIQFEGNVYPGRDSVYIVKQSNHWIFSGTGLTNGSSFGLGYASQGIEPVVSGEMDMMRSTVSPSNTQILGRAYIRRSIYGDPDYPAVDSLFSDVGYYEDTVTNTRAFAAGVFGWNACLYGQDSVTMRTMTRNILDHFSMKKYTGKIYATPNSPWDSNIEFDGNVYLLANKTLSLSNFMTLTIDAGDTLFVDGTLQLNGSATIAGPGIIKVNSTGKITVNSGGTLILNGSTIISVAAGGKFTIQSGGLLKASAGASVRFGTGDSLKIYGRLVAAGTSSQPVTFTSLNSTPSPGDWYGLFFKGGGQDTLTYCTIKYATDGIMVRDTVNGPILTNCTMRRCSGNGIYALNSPCGGCMNINTCTIDSNAIGIKLDHSWASLGSSTEIKNNASHGISLLTGAYMYLSNTLVHDNSGWGVIANGTTCNVYFSPDGIGRGYDHVGDNASGQVYAEGGASVSIGERVSGCDCPGAATPLSYSGGDSHGEITSSCPPGCWWATHDYEGYNTIYGGYPWVRNDNSGTILKAQLTYWGNLPDCPPPDAAFGGSGSVDRTVPLGCDAPPPESPIGSKDGNRIRAASGFVPSTEDSITLAKSLIAYLRQLVVDNPDSAGDAISQLSALIGPAGRFQNLSPISWDAFLDTLEEHSPSLGIRAQAGAYRIQARMEMQDFTGALSLIDVITAQSSLTDDRWFYLKLQKVYAYLFTRDHANAQAVLDAMRTRAAGINESAIQELSTLVAADSTSAAPSGPADLQPVKSLSPRNVSVRGQQEELLQNYPNPFNPLTVIRYSLSEEGQVLLRVYNALGQEVRMLVNEHQSAGSHEITFDARDLPSGTYYYHLQAGKFSEVRKLLFVK